MTTGDPGNGNGREVELLVRWKGAFQLGMLILGLFCVDVNVVGGNRGKVEGGFSTWDFDFGIAHWWGVEWGEGPSKR